MSVVEDLLFEKLFSFLWKAIKLIGAFFRFPFVNRQYSLQRLSNQNVSGFVGIIVMLFLTALVFFY